ncbi:MAG: hypothetical protein K940chlam5_00400 [Candidatus Anoxychlamydiales bacterium]|nr:hypothetical protein [Candidatus Anoxychlamydiales bacterium]
MALIVENSLISSFIDKRIICGDLRVEESKCSEISRSAFKVAGVSISALGRIPFVPVSLKLKSLGFFRYFLAAGNTVGFWVVGSWSILNVIDEFTQPLTKEEKILLENHLSTLAKTVSIASSLVLSITSKSVTAYIAYTYNNENILMPIAVMLSDTSFPFYSSLLSTRKLLEKRSFSEIEKKINLMRYEIIELIESNRSLFVSKNKSEKEDSLTLFNRIKFRASKDERLKEFLPIIFQKNPEVEQTKIEKYGKNFFGLNGVHLTLSHMAFLGIISYVGGQLLTSSSVGGVIAATLTIGSNVYLEGTSLVKTAKRAFGGLYNLFTCRRRPALSKQLSPKLTFALSAIGLLTSIHSWGPNVQVADDYIEQKGFKAYMEIVSTMAIVLLVSTAMLDIIDGIVEKKIDKLGTKEEKEILEIDRKMKRLVNVIDKSPLIEFVKFAKIIPKETLDEVQKKCNVTQSELDHYIQEYYRGLDEKKLSKEEELSPFV